ncbi:MAG: response regulator transcription factor [Nitrospina sp.]|jgi:DNA-binding response OmpR family regulator|nr:response regulator transcription factor [Nitrospina sp.]MBT5985664.1 response regulator transcription factor [Nitrospina sp.]
MAEANKILLVEDDPHLAKGLQFNLEREGYEVFLVDNGASALEQLREKDFDLIVLDLMLPGLGGLEVARTIRETNIRFPILMLTAKSSKKDREIGLQAGADDYLTKPFHLPELLLRIKGILRRSEWYKEPVHDQDVFRFSEMWINFRTGKVKGVDGEFYLTTKEALVMKLLVEKKDDIVSREELLEKVWGYDPQTETRTVDNFISRLRKYFEKRPQKPVHILTVREKGYQFVSGSDS